ncbi:hypothetical protein [uncultured Bacteroides sp.]|uniref:helix-turn-helix transcriptional regulator n=1 Tax=uncultured Bacteroides sp. TaxID=162156 RepID=UPI0025CC4BAD|nr:hypothetical protein [uncultured Bacteroides sp.]
MKPMHFFSSLILLLILTACSSPANPILLNYEQSLVRADSLANAGAADSAHAVRLLADLHREYDRVKELSGGKRVRLMPADKRKQFFLGAFTALMIGLNVWLSIRDIKFSTDRKHRRYLIELSENEQRLRNNELEKNELQECLKEMSLTDEEREEIHRSLTNLMVHGNLLCDENESLRTRLKDYENRPLPRELEVLRKEGERAHVLDGQVQALTSALIDRDGVVGQLRSHPKFLTDEQWKYLQTLTDRVYEGFTTRLAGRFPKLTPADLQLCLLIRLRFTNAQVATLTAVSPASVSQQKFRLKKRLLQMDEALFANGETVDAVVEGC